MNMPNNPALDKTVRQFKFQYNLSKISLGFFTSLYLLAGLGMLVVSFTLEAKVFLTMLGETAYISYLTAACLEAAKLGTIIVYDFIDRKKRIEASTKTVSEKILGFVQTLFKRGFQISLFLISMLCVSTVISEQFDRPNMENIRALELSNLQTNYQRNRSELDTQQGVKQKELEHQQIALRKSIEARYKPLIGKAEKGMEKERHMPDSRGNILGKRYRSYESTLTAYQTNLQKELDKHNNLATKQTHEQRLRHSKNLSELSDQFTANQNTIQHQNYKDDGRVEHKSIKAIVDTLNYVLSLFNVEKTLLPISFVAIFALMLSAIIECGIFLSLSSFVAVFFPYEFSTVEVEMEASQKKTIKTGLSPETI